MSLHYLLDGYNIIKQVPALANKDLRSGRLALCHFIESQKPQGSQRNKITVVFDGKSDVGPFPKPHSIAVIFSQDKSADDEIKAIVEKTPHRATLVVVSDDRNLKLDCRALGARIISVQEFLSKPKTIIKHNEERKDIPFDVEYKINKELGRLWLKE
jgi:predicted RNA-binding protein with PIN domain